MTLALEVYCIFPKKFEKEKKIFSIPFVLFACKFWRSCKVSAYVDSYIFTSQNVNRCTVWIMLLYSKTWKLLFIIFHLYSQMVTITYKSSLTHMSAEWFLLFFALWFIRCTSYQGGRSMSLHVYLILNSCTAHYSFFPQHKFLKCQLMENFDKNG